MVMGAVAVAEFPAGRVVFCPQPGLSLHNGKVRGGTLQQRGKHPRLTIMMVDVVMTLSLSQTSVQQPQDAVYSCYSLEHRGAPQRHLDCS